MALPELDLSSLLWTALPAVLIALFVSSYIFKPAPAQRSSPTTDPIPMSSSDSKSGAQKEAFAVPDSLAPPKDDPYTLAELAQYDGNDASRPILLSIKGTVFDVSPKRDTYGPGGGYSVFAGKDGSRGLGMSSLKPEDAVPDWSTLPPDERKVLEDWHAYFKKRYNIVGRITDLPEAVKNA